MMLGSIHYPSRLWINMSQTQKKEKEKEKFTVAKPEANQQRKTN
jgi:hypothetical protein